MTGNRLKAFLIFRYRHFYLTLIRHLNRGLPRLLMELTAKFIKTFLDLKDAYVFIYLFT
jgi:hypothetical protein